MTGRYQRVDRAPAPRVAPKAVLTAIGCDEDGWRRVPGLGAVDTESYDSWLAFLRRVRARGAAGVQLLTSDATRSSGARWRRSFRTPHGSGASCT